MWRTRSIALCLSAVVCALAAAQEAKKQEMPPPPQPGPEHRKLKELEGAWDAIVTGMDGKKTKAEATYKMELGGLWLTSDFRGEMDGKPFQGKGMDTYDPAKKKHIGVWADSMMTVPLVLEGTRDESTKTTTTSGEAPGPDGKPMKMKGVTKEIDKDHMTFELYAPGPDGKEAKMMTIEYTRRKK